MFLCRSLKNSFLRHAGRQLFYVSLVQDLQGNSPAPSAFFARAAERGKKFAKLKWNSGSLSQTKLWRNSRTNRRKEGRRKEKGNSGGGDEGAKSRYL